MAQTKLVKKAAPMGKKTKIILLVIGAAALVAAAVLLLRKKVSANPNPPSGGANLKVTLTGLDPAATVWEMTIFDNLYTHTLNTGSNSIPVTQSAQFTVPADWELPLKVVISVYKDTVPGVASPETQIVDVQSYNTAASDYAPIFINALGNITFNCGTKNFES